MIQWWLQGAIHSITFIISHLLIDSFTISFIRYQLENVTLWLTCLLFYSFIHVILITISFPFTHAMMIAMSSLFITNHYQWLIHRFIYYFIHSFNINSTKFDHSIRITIIHSLIDSFTISFIQYQKNYCLINLLTTLLFHSFDINCNHFSIHSDTDDCNESFIHYQLLALIDLLGYLLFYSFIQSFTLWLIFFNNSIITICHLLNSPIFLSFQYQLQ